MESFASSYIASMAEKRGRNVEWAKSAVVTSESITATKALELKVIDLIAADLLALQNKPHCSRSPNHSLAPHARRPGKAIS